LADFPDFWDGLPLFFFFAIEFAGEFLFLVLDLSKLDATIAFSGIALLILGAGDEFAAVDFILDEFVTGDFVDVTIRTPFRFRIKKDQIRCGLHFPQLTINPGKSGINPAKH
jgi:hypothetical protein